MSIPEFDSPREQYDATPAVVTAVVKNFEHDVRALLDYIAHDYVPPDMVLIVRRLRLLVGDE